MKIVGTVENEATNSLTSEDGSSIKVGLEASQKGASVNISDTNTTSQKLAASQRSKEQGVRELSINFGSVGASLKFISNCLAGKRVWVLLDEWVSIPHELQPYLAECLRRTIFRVPRFTVKIATIEHRSRFRIASEQGEYVGIEVGADAAADLILDDFMVFQNKSSEAQTFFEQLVYKHVMGVENFTPRNLPYSADTLISDTFTTRAVFIEFVRAAEGVPRDAINILRLAAQLADNDKIAMVHIHRAARAWYQSDKEKNVADHAEAYALLEWIMPQVIDKLKARAFLLKSNTKHPLIDTLFDERVLHVLKKGVSGSDHPGVRFDVYGLDYGCYIDLRGTKKYPEGLLAIFDELGQDSFTDVPIDDHRAIRRSILDLEVFEGRTKSLFD